VEGGVAFLPCHRQYHYIYIYIYIYGREACDQTTKLVLSCLFRRQVAKGLGAGDNEKQHPSKVPLLPLGDVEVSNILDQLQYAGYCKGWRTNSRFLNPPNISLIISNWSLGAAVS